MGIPLAVGALDMNDGDVRLDRSHGEQAGAAERIVNWTDARMAADDVSPNSSEGWQIGQTHSGSLERQSNREVGVVLHHDPARHALLIGPPKPIARSARHIAHPGGDHLRHGAGGDQLVERHVGDRPDQRQVAPLLADDFVNRGEWYPRLEGEAQRDGVAIMNVLRDRLAEGSALVLQW